MTARNAALQVRVGSFVGSHNHSRSDRFTNYAEDQDFFNGLLNPERTAVPQRGSKVSFFALPQ